MDLTVQTGTFHGVIGPNGAGKSTLFDIILGFRPPSIGTVRVLGQPPRPRDENLYRKVGVQPQRTAFFPKLSVREHLSALAGIYGSGETRTGRLMEVLDLARHANTRAEKLSGGERQRLAIASALVHEPQLLLLDEPTAGLDPAARHNLVDLLRSPEFRGMTTIYTTHYLEEASRLCDVVSILDAGKVLVTKSPSELIAETGVEATILLPAAVHQADRVAALSTITSVDVDMSGLHACTGDTALAFAELAGAGIDTGNAQVFSGSLETAFMAYTGRNYEA
ncbi:ABC transporter ATP-binding protein [Arthrobacter sp. G119Y2]|uniref:ABC transporter ATP-binding protein n=1 Tax=Arthrobacter sp. G119Y2 TaxID=3134965 RepID=UPI003119F657